VVDKTAEALNDHAKALKGANVLILGVAYKKDIDDLRESPALTIIELLRQKGTNVFYNDPYFAEVGRGRHYNLNMKCVSLDDLAKYDCVLIVTDHSSYNYPQIARDALLVVDTRNAMKGIQSANIVRC
jgi:UDP-N-acetyl-D-glucosamine dehydrogenase